MIGGLWGWLAFLGSFFTIGANDSAQEVLALTAAFLTTLPACVVALWRRLLAGIWLMLNGCFLLYAAVAQRSYMIKVRHFPDQPTIFETIERFLPYTAVLVGIGLFAVMTELRKWPRLIGVRQHSEG
jgi:hypothetical protein